MKTQAKTRKQARATVLAERDLAAALGGSGSLAFRTWSCPIVRASRAPACARSRAPAQLTSSRCADGGRAGSCADARNRHL